MATEAASINFRGISGKGMGAPILLVMMLAMIVIPMPPIALDMLYLQQLSQYSLGAIQ